MILTEEKAEQLKGIAIDVHETLALCFSNVDAVLSCFGADKGITLHTANKFLEIFHLVVQRMMRQVDVIYSELDGLAETAQPDHEKGEDQ